MSASPRASRQWYEHPYDWSKLGLSAAKSVYNVALFQNIEKLAPAGCLVPYRELRSDQTRLHILVQKLAPFVPELRNGDQAEYVDKVDAVRFTIQKGIDELGRQAEESKSGVVVDISCRSINLLFTANKFINRELQQVQVAGENFSANSDEFEKVIEQFQDDRYTKEQIKEIMGEKLPTEAEKTMIGLSIGWSSHATIRRRLEARCQAAHSQLEELVAWAKSKNIYATATAFTFSTVPMPASHGTSSACGDMLARFHEDVWRVTSRSHPRELRPTWCVKLVRCPEDPSETLARVSSYPDETDPKPPTNMLVRGIAGRTTSQQVIRTWDLLFVETVKLDDDAAVKTAHTRFRGVPLVKTFSEFTRAKSWPVQQDGYQEAYPIGKHQPELSKHLHVLYKLSGGDLKKSVQSIADRLVLKRWVENAQVKLRFELACMVALFFVTGHDLMHEMRTIPTLKELIFISMGGDMDDEAQQWTAKRLEMQIYWEQRFGHQASLKTSLLSTAVKPKSRHRIIVEIGMIHALLTGSRIGIECDVKPAGILKMKAALLQRLRPAPSWTAQEEEGILGYDASLRLMLNQCLLWRGSLGDSGDDRRRELEIKQKILEGLRFVYSACNR